MIEVKELNKCYNNKQILKNISFSLENGKIYALVGKNGSGKTTLLNAISSYVFKDGGKVIIDGIDSTQFAAKYKVCYVSDNKNCFLNYTAREYVEFIKKIYKQGKETQIKLERYIEELQLQGEINKFIGECSFGTKQKIYLLGSLVSNSTNLILDEPFNGLDPLVSAVLRDVLKEKAREGRMILYSTHSLDVVSNYSDTILFLGDANITKYNNNESTYEKIYSKFVDLCETSCMS